MANTRAKNQDYIKSKFNILSSSPEEDVVDSKSNSPTPSRARGARKTRLSVTLDKLIPNPLNMYSMKADEDFEELIAGLKRDGQQEDIVVKDNKDGTYTIISGHRRYQGLKTIGAEKAGIILADSINTKSEEIAMIARGNTGTRQKRPYDVAAQMKLFIEALNEEGFEGAIADRIKTEFNLSDKTYYNYEYLVTLPDKLISFGKEGWLIRDEGISLAKILKKEGGEERIRDFTVRATDALEQTSEEKKRETLQKLVANQLRAEKRQETIFKGSKAPNVNTVVKRVDKLVQSVLDAEEFKIPAKKEKREETVKMLEESIAALEKIRDKIVS